MRMWRQTSFPGNSRYPTCWRSDHTRYVICLHQLEKAPWYRVATDWVGWWERGRAVTSVLLSSKASNDWCVCSIFLWACRISSPSDLCVSSIPFHHPFQPYTGLSFSLPWRESTTILSAPFLFYLFDHRQMLERCHCEVEHWCGFAAEWATLAGMHRC